MDRTPEGVVPGFERLMVLDRVARAEEGMTAAGRVAAVVRAAKFEVIPLKGALEAVTTSLPLGATVTVTSSPTKGIDPTIALCEELAAAGFDAVPHLAARLVRDAAHLGDLTARLDGAGVRRVFVVGGDGEPAGDFPDGLSLLRTMTNLGHRFEEVGVPAYPEGHATIPGDVLWGALLEKQPLADTMTTQLCFDPNAIVRWLAEARGRGVTLPVEVGLPSPVDLPRLVQISTRIGVADSARYLSKNRGVIGALLRRRAFRPDPLLRGLTATFADPHANVQGLHLYTFNQLGDAAEWQRRTLARLAAQRRPRRA